jgi:hypothetical protein
MLQNYATIPLYITHKNVTFCHEGTGVQKGFLVAACLLACSLFKHPLLSVVCTISTVSSVTRNSHKKSPRFKSPEFKGKFSGHLGQQIFRIRELTVEMVQYHTSSKKPLGST